MVRRLTCNIPACAINAPTLFRLHCYGRLSQDHEPDILKLV